MSRFKRFIGLVVLAGFLGLTAAESAHVHKELGTAPITDCAVCKIAHQTPGLMPTAHALTVNMAVLDSISEHSTPLYVVFAFTAHGLSPPTL